VAKAEGRNFPYIIFHFSLQAQTAGLQTPPAATCSRRLPLLSGSGHLPSLLENLHLPALNRGTIGALAERLPISCRNLVPFRPLL